MKHITLVTLDYPPSRGGVARYLGELVSASKGVIGTVVVEPSHGLNGPGSVVPRIFFWHGWPKWWPMVRICREAMGQLILTSHVLPVGTAAMIAKWMGGKPYAVICHGLDVRLAAISWRKKQLFRMVCRHAKQVIANSENTAADIRQIAPSITPLVLTPGVTPSQTITRNDARVQLGIEPGEEIILAVARLVKRKGIDLLMEATERLRDRENIRTVIVGDGEELANLRQLAEHLKHRVTFVTDAEDAHVADWYASADVFCLPARASQNDVEGFGIVYLEAAMHGLPVVATDTGGVREAVLDGETGLLVPPDDLEALAGALRRVLSDSGLRTRLGEAGRSRALKDFRWADRWHRLSEALKTA